jgi:ubiquinone/menaquinone biosynthesis C-methylase UbiE
VEERTDYEALAPRYDEDRARWSFPPDDVVAGLLASPALGTALRVVDLGCGTGRWLEAQRAAYAGAPTVEWVGVDPSAAMLEEAAAKRLANLVRARAEDLPLEEGSVHYVASSYAFHHFADKDRALDEVTRILVADGAFRINNIEPAAAEDWWVYRYFPEAAEIDAARFWPVDRIADGLRARGFRVEIDLDGGPREIPAAEARADAERRVVSQLALLDDGAYERGLARLREVAADPHASVTTTRSRLQLTAYRSESAST